MVPRRSGNGKRETGNGGPVSPNHLNATLISAGSLGLALGVRLVAAPLVRVTIPQRPETAAQIPVPPVDAHPDSLAAAVVARDPFRVARRPANVSYDPVRLAQPV